MRMTNTCPACGHMLHHDKNGLVFCPHCGWGMCTHCRHDHTH